MSFPSRSPFFRLGIFLAIAFPTLAGGYFAASLLEAEPAPRTYACKKPVVEPAAVPVSDVNADSREIFKIVDRMPIFPGVDCGDIRKYKERKQCSDKAMLGYIYSHVKYPDNAREEGVEGMAVVSFVVEKNGVISNINVVRDPGAGLGEAAAKVVRRMRADNIRWEAGLHKGKPVRVQFNLPVKFKLE